MLTVPRLALLSLGCLAVLAVQQLVPGHYGLESMRSRAEELGGQLELANGAGGGTTVRVRVPRDP